MYQLFIALVLSILFVQDVPTATILSVENYQAFQPVIQIDLETFDTSFDSGWFLMNDDASRLAIVDQRGVVFILDDEGQLIERYSPFNDGRLHPGSVIDGIFIDSQFYAIHRVEDYYTLGTMPFYLEGYYPQAIWANHAGEIFIEAIASDTTTENMIFAVTLDEDVPILAPLHPYAPSEDETAVVRIGRIHAPYAVTSSQDGIVTLWDLEAGMVLAQMDNGLGQPSVFGAINSALTHLVWRDNLNQTLYLLDFGTGINRIIDELDGDYAQWFFLSADASVILAVNLGFEPNVVAWDVITGERTVLGTYRACDRPQPDMARFSADGTTLVIGCDTGLELWRIHEGE